MEQQMKIIADAVNEIMRQTLVDRNEIERLQQLVDTLEEEVVNLCQQRLKLRETLYEIAKGPRDVDKSYVSLLHEVQSEARQALGEEE